MSLGNDPRNTSSIDEVEAVAAAKQAQAELRFDGAAPSEEAILREMGRYPDGRPLGDQETLPSHEASHVARELLDHSGSEKR